VISVTGTALIAAVANIIIFVLEAVKVPVLHVFFPVLIFNGGKTIHHLCVTLCFLTILAGGRALAGVYYGWVFTFSVHRVLFSKYPYIFVESPTAYVCAEKNVVGMVILRRCGDCGAAVDPLARKFECPENNHQHDHRHCNFLLSGRWHMLSQRSGAVAVTREPIGQRGQRRFKKKKDADTSTALWLTDVFSTYNAQT
jgi:hypothetical protein